MALRVTHNSKLAKANSVQFSPTSNLKMDFFEKKTNKMNSLKKIKH